ncbi:hypothetical protein ABPG72_010271 [Tetrahymena utriculariae]
MNQISDLKNQLQKLIAKRQDLQHQIFNLQIQSESFNQKQQQIEQDLIKMTKAQTLNEIHNSFSVSKNDRSSDQVQHSFVSTKPSTSFIQKNDGNSILSSLRLSNQQYLNQQKEGLNLSQISQSLNQSSLTQINRKDLQQVINLQDDVSILNQQLINSDEDERFENMDDESQNGNLNELKYNPADKSSNILNSKNQKYLETLKMFQLEGKGQKHTEQVLNKMIENWVPKNQYKTYHTLSNGKVIDHSHIKSIPKAVVRLSDEVTGNRKQIVHDFRGLEILETDDPETVIKKKYIKQRYDQFIKMFKQIQPKYIQESGYCKYTDGIRKMFVFFTQLMSRNKINRDSGVKPDTLKAWAKKYGYVDDSILEVKDLDQEI